MKNISIYIYDYMCRLWDIASLNEQRTVSQTLAFQQRIHREE